MDYDTPSNIRTLINSLNEVCGSPVQAAYYRVLCPQVWKFLSDLALGWCMVRNERFITSCYTLFLHCLEDCAVVDNQEAGYPVLEVLKNIHGKS